MPSAACATSAGAAETFICGTNAAAIIINAITIACIPAIHLCLVSFINSFTLTFPKIFLRVLIVSEAHFLSVRQPPAPLQLTQYGATQQHTVRQFTTLFNKMHPFFKKSHVDSFLQVAVTLLSIRLFYSPVTKY